MTKCQVIQVFMEKVICDDQPRTKDKITLGLNPKLDLKKIHASWFSGIQALTERLSKILQQCEIQFRTRIQFLSLIHI